jgi:uncharacterized repeat protein (TIGR01451 family)
MRRRYLRRLVACMVALTAATGFVLLTGGPAAAAPGDILRTINVTPPPACGLSLGVGFDGTDLLVSTTCDTTITRVDPANGNVRGTVNIAGVLDGTIDAISWDAKDNLLWLADGSHNVYSAVLDKTTGTGVATLRFSAASFGGFPLTDGLAFDGTDDTIWYSPDVSATIFHFTETGVLLGTRPGVLGSCNNSGLVVADATSLYMGNDGCSQIWFGDKAGTTTTFFASLSGKRVEDLECDNTTFAPKSVIWSKDAFDYELNAFEVTAGQCAQGGVIPVGADVSIVKTGPPVLPRGFHITYTLTIANAGPATADNVVVTDPLPSGLRAPSATTTQGTCTVTSGTVSCSLGSLAMGQTVTIRIVAGTGPHIASPMTNTASVTSSTSDPVTANNSSTAVTVLTP